MKKFKDCVDSNLGYRQFFKSKIISICLFTVQIKFFIFLYSRLEKPQLFEEARAEYLKDRDEFQHSYVETGRKKKMGRKESAF